MPPLEIGLDPRSFREEPLDPAARLLVRGALLVFPTETVYGLGCTGAFPDTVQRLYALKHRRPDKPLARLLPRPEDLLDLVRPLPPPAARLVRAFWPGPLTLVLEHQGVSAGFRCPDHPAAAYFALAAGGDLLATSANLAGGPDPGRPEDIPIVIRECVDVLIDAGPCPVGRPSTVARAGTDSIEVLREGAVSETAVTYFDCFSVLFVCTGNTCRSPMAAALLRARLGRELGLPPDALADAGLLVQSAGTHAFAGGAAAANAIRAVEEMGADLRSHRSAAVDAPALLEADRVVAMTSSHLRDLEALLPEGHGSLALLDPEGGSIDDPVGGDLEVYRRTAERIDRLLDPLVRQGVRWYNERRARRGPAADVEQEEDER